MDSSSDGKDDCSVWNNSHIFVSLDDASIESVLTQSSKRIEQLAQHSDYFSRLLQDMSQAVKAIPKAQSFMLESHDINVELATLKCFVQSVLAVDAKNEQASALLSRVSQSQTELAKTQASLDAYLDVISDDELEMFLNHAVLSNWRFRLQHRREQTEFRLDHAQEKLLSGLQVDGLHAWGNLHKTLCGQLRCHIDGDVVGFAKAASILRSGDRNKRESAWRAINNAWEIHQESAAAILNAINGWRLEENKARSSIKPLHYLDRSCHQHHITRKTLEVLMSTTFDASSIGRRALKAMAKGMGVERLAPWDILAPAPSLSVATSAKKYGFREAIYLIAEAFSTLTTEMSDFAIMMYKNNWIDARETPFRAPGAYCTLFSKQREPRVFMTFNGSIGNVITLAHELGHAYHHWIMRDLHRVKASYAFTTAETASIFAETLVRDYLFARSKNDEDRFVIAWQDAETAGIMLCNIPARYDFEKSMIEGRKRSTLSPGDLCQLSSHAWSKWYQDTLTEYDEWFWASKMHFSFSEITFYNYPYLFGYLFSLGIYAEKDRYGDDFVGLYKSILRDTGSVNAVDLISKHLNHDIEAPSFWVKALNHVEKMITRFESLVAHRA